MTDTVVRHINVQPREESQLHRGVKIILRYQPNEPVENRWKYICHIPKVQYVAGTAKDRGHALGTAKRIVNRALDK